MAKGQILAVTVDGQVAVSIICDGSICVAEALVGQDILVITDLHGIGSIAGLVSVAVGDVQLDLCLPVGLDRGIAGHRYRVTISGGGVVGHGNSSCEGADICSVKATICNRRNFKGKCVRSAGRIFRYRIGCLPDRSASRNHNGRVESALYPICMASIRIIFHGACRTAGRQGSEGKIRSIFQFLLGPIRLKCVILITLDRNEVYVNSLIFRSVHGDRAALKFIICCNRGRKRCLHSKCAEQRKSQQKCRNSTNFYTHTVLLFYQDIALYALCAADRQARLIITATAAFGVPIAQVA